MPQSRERALGQVERNHLATTASYGIAVIPSSVQIPPGKVHTVPLVHRGASIGRWNVTAWDPQRSLAPYAVQFIEELTVYTRRQYPNRDLTRRAPSLPQLHKPVLKLCRRRRVQRHSSL